jgi:hypothetical protein
MTIRFERRLRVVARRGRAPSLRSACLRHGVGLVLLVLAACGGEIGDRGPNDGGDRGDSGDADTGADVAVRTCDVCDVATYSCTRPGLESFTLVLSEKSETGCLGINPMQVAATWSFDCVTLDACNPTGCYPMTVDSAGTLTWTPTGQSTITCFS